jgi:hypothetical protein
MFVLQAIANPKIKKEYSHLFLKRKYKEPIKNAIGMTSNCPWK